MNRTGFTRLTGVVILIGAVFGLIISIYGLYALWTARPAVTSGINDGFSLATQTMDATDKMLVTINTSLDKASQDLILMRRVLTDTAGTIGQSTSTVDDTAKLMGEDMLKVIGDTQSALKSTQTTAQIIDDTLQTISGIPLIGGWLTSRYTPDVPLNQAVQNVNKSLDPLPGSFTKVHDDLKTASASMATIKAEVESLATQVDNIQTSLTDAQSEIKNYQLIMADTRDRMDRIQARLPVVIDTAFMGITIILLWVGISQIGALLHAADILSRKEI